MKAREFWLLITEGTYSEVKPDMGSEEHKFIHVREVLPDEPDRLHDCVDRQKELRSEISHYKNLAEELANALRSLVGQEPFKNTLEPYRASEALAHYRKATGDK